MLMLLLLLLLLPKPRVALVGSEAAMSGNCAPEYLMMPGRW
jgi:hypothetical protein